MRAQPRNGDVAARRGRDSAAAAMQRAQSTARQLALAHKRARTPRYSLYLISSGFSPGLGGIAAQ